MTTALPVTQMTSRLAVPFSDSASLRNSWIFRPKYGLQAGRMTLTEELSCDSSKHSNLNLTARKFRLFSRKNGILIGCSNSCSPLLVVVAVSNDETVICLAGVIATCSMGWALRSCVGEEFLVLGQICDGCNLCKLQLSLMPVRFVFYIDIPLTAIVSLLSWKLTVFVGKTFHRSDNDWGKRP